MNNIFGLGPPPLLNRLSEVVPSAKGLLQGDGAMPGRCEWVSRVSCAKCAKDFVCKHCRKRFDQEL